MDKEHGMAQGTPCSAGEEPRDRLLAEIESTCPSPPAPAGQLLGGAITVRFAIDHSNRLSRLVLVDSFLPRRGTVACP